MRRRDLVVFCEVDVFLGPRGQALFGFERFTALLEEMGIPCVWVTARTRGQLDEPRRRLAASHPFIAEDGCGVYLPEDYFHFKQGHRLRLGRFLCIPVAQTQPAGSEALEDLAKEACLEVVAVRNLTPREISQNTNLPPRESELLRSRDFDELFFFAGATEKQIRGFLQLAEERRIALRPHGSLWSLAVGASVSKCIRELAQLYDRALHKRVLRVAIEAAKEAGTLSAPCDHIFQIISGVSSLKERENPGQKRRSLTVSAPDLWETILKELSALR